jgi:hypothetical protein
MHRTLRTIHWSALIAISLAAACSSDTTGANTSGSQLGFAVSRSLGASPDAAPITVGGHTLNLTSVTITVSRAELKPAASVACSDEQGDGDLAPSFDGGVTTSPTSDGCGEMKIGPTTIDLPLDGSVASVPADAIPAGTFGELELRLAFVRLQGTFDGKAFDVTVATPIRGDIQFTRPLTVTAGTATSITVTVPITALLTNADGSLVDPSQLNTDATLRNAFLSRLAASFHAFEDNNHDGRDDHGQG